MDVFIPVKDLNRLRSLEKRFNENDQNLTDTLSRLSVAIRSVSIEYNFQFSEPSAVSDRIETSLHVNKYNRDRTLFVFV